MANHHDPWHQRWQAGQIAFHEAAPNRHLVRFWPSLGVPQGGRVLVPLCGKSNDLTWLVEHGHEVVGVELSPIACAAYFAERGIAPDIADEDRFVRWSGGGVTLLQGDIFDLDAAGTFDAVWDRAALIALPPELRARYATHVRAQLRAGGPLLLVTLVYDQARRAGPPFSVPDDEVRTLHPGAELYLREQLEEERWKDLGGAEEAVWGVGTSP